MILRDSHGVAQVRYITGNKILRILKAKGTYTMLILDSKLKEHLMSCLLTLCMFQPTCKHFACFNLHVNQCLLFLVRFGRKSS